MVWTIPLILLFLVGLWLLTTRIIIPSYQAGVPMIDNPSKHTSLIDAVYNRSSKGVEKLITQGADLEITKSDGSTPLLLAVETDQFGIAEKLIDAGANVFAVSKFGDSVGRAVENSNVNSEARKRVMDLLKLKGFPFPAPHRTEVIKMIETGTWPPKKVPTSSQTE